MTVRTRFAPSPTGKVHIGNIRAAIYNQLFARHEGGVFTLRIEDTDRERSTPEAIEYLFDVLQWLGLDSDETPLYQSQRREAHLDAARRLEQDGTVYRHAKGEGGEALLFRIPWRADEIPGVEELGPAERALHPDHPVRLDHTGIRYSAVSRKGKPVDTTACLAGFADLRLFDANGQRLFSIGEHIEGILEGRHSFEIDNAARMTFTRRSIGFDDEVRGRLTKPLDDLKDFVLVRSDGSPVFHLANICDDLHQRITHIIRGEDHVENTFRHLFLYHALGARPPAYAHLPMIVNAQGKPYSKRDGDAFVGDFREKGVLPEALYNYLALLGWSPGGDREKLDRESMVKEFSLDRVQASPARVDLNKLAWLNGEYLREKPHEEVLAGCRSALTKRGLEPADPDRLRDIVMLFGDRFRTVDEFAEQAAFFFTDEFETDEKAARKHLAAPHGPEVLDAIRERFAALDPFEASRIQDTLRHLAEERGEGFGKIMTPLRVAISGQKGGPDLAETAALLGRDTVLRRIGRAAARSGA
ncbi:glutamate--tRNA ligase [Kiritimatiella glycovorans]|uniref:Glutamate--tRNA ligase n=1 Tax=Kiritimatiella glycovorans TaxID=1307763 RepID=A0A0G3EBW9_9BACT|nr:glutamate--tRNA ligase [Kiritimatiella glycovorans]AKJ63798.1 Glutamate--tRNA ligase [Kiritimatiella glycovorans]